MATKPCHRCQGPTVKVIYAGFPMRLCEREDCSTGSGFWSWVPGLLMPFDGVFMAYSGSYLAALRVWLMGGPEA